MLTSSKPVLVGDGPVVFSTCTDLAPVPQWIADVNGYYRDLRVDVRATRAQIRQAYLERGTGSDRLTFVAKQLLNREVRHRYDRTPLGSIFYDRDVDAWFRRTQAIRFSGRSQSTADTPIQEVIDTDRTEGESLLGPANHWSYAFYLWGTDQVDIPRLREWQELLVRTLGSRGEHHQLAVGLAGGMESPTVVSVLGYRVVAFLRDDEGPTEVLAQAVANQLSPNQSHFQNRISTSMTTSTESVVLRPNFRRGAEAAEEASKGGNFARTNYFGIEDGKSAILRLLTDKDDWRVVDQHSSVPTKPKPADYPATSQWPAKMGAVCRHDEVLRPIYPDCFICDNIVGTGDVKKAGGRTWALACLREEVIGDGSEALGGAAMKGKVLGLRDQVREVAEVDDKGKPTGNTYKEKAIVVVNMGYKNFFNSLAGFAGHYGTVLDRDYLIRRSGSGTDTTYQIIPLDPIVMPDGRRYDLREPDLMAAYKSDLDLDELLMDRSSDEFYARFFDTRVSNATPAKNGQTTAPAPDKPANDASADRLAALASRVTDYSAPATPAAAAAATAAPEAAAPAAGAPPLPGMRFFG